MFFKRILTISVAAFLPLSPASAEVYKWVDDAGNVHFGDRIPEQYKQAGSPVELSDRQPSEAERRQARALVESARQTANALRERRLNEAKRLEEVSDKPGQTSTASKVSTAPVKKRPGQARLTREQRMKNYEAQMERYRESMRCFGKYQKLGGGTRGYAFEECETVSKPRHPDVQ